jgi:DNA modification methylase
MVIMRGLFYSNDIIRLYLGDAQDILKELPADSVHCVITSPPYWGLRDYGVASQLGLETTPEDYCAKKLNRHCIGIEINEAYCEIAAKRCAQSVMRLEL